MRSVPGFTNHLTSEVRSDTEQNGGQSVSLPTKRFTSPEDHTEQIITPVVETTEQKTVQKSVQSDPPLTIEQNELKRLAPEDRNTVWNRCIEVFPRPSKGDRLKYLRTLIDGKPNGQPKVVEDKQITEDRKIPKPKPDRVDVLLKKLKSWTIEEKKRIISDLEDDITG